MVSKTSPDPSSRAKICSIGPPGTNWVNVKLISIMPNNVGMTSKSRLRIYVPMLLIPRYRSAPTDRNPSALLWSNHQ